MLQIGIKSKKIFLKDILIREEGEIYVAAINTPIASSIEGVRQVLTQREFVVMSFNEPIRVAQIIGKMWAGGVEAVTFNYYKAIDHSKIQFDFYYDADSTVEPPQDLINMGAKFYKLPPYQKLWKYIPALRCLLKDKHYTIIHSHLNTLSVFPLFTAWTAGIPVRIAHNHSVPGGNEWKRNTVKAVLKKFAKVFATDYFACSEKAGRWLFGDKEFNKGNITVIKNAIDFEKFKIVQDRVEELQNRYKLCGATVYGHVGRFTFAKNHTKLLTIFKVIHDRNLESKLLLVGDGELHDQIKREIYDLGLEQAVILTGKVYNPEEYYPLIDVMILPSHFEGLSMTTIEAQVSKVPIVVSKAIPTEAVISDSCVYMDITATDVQWADVAESLVGKTVKLDERKDKYDIYRCALKLGNWYINKQHIIENGGRYRMN